MSAAMSLAILGLVAVHVLAALRHHVLLKDDVLVRMLPVRRREAAGGSRQTGV